MFAPRDQENLETTKLSNCAENALVSAAGRYFDGDLNSFGDRKLAKAISAHRAKRRVRGYGDSCAGIALPGSIERVVGKRLKG
jgi:hypothetical protein